MNLNLTFFGEILTFAVLVFVTMKYIWPPVIKVMEGRQQKIAQGLAAAERGQHDLEIAKEKATCELRDGAQKAHSLVEQAEREAAKIIESARAIAHRDNARILALTRATLEKEKTMIARELQHHVVGLAVEVASKILQKKLDIKDDQLLVEKFISEINVN